MENAGRGAAEELARRLQSQDRSAFFVGKGNNGGDGYTMARHLQRMGFSVTIFRLAKKGEIRGDAKTQREAAITAGIEEVDISSRTLFRNQKLALGNFDWHVDGILGVGLSSPLSGLYKEVVDFINGASKKRVALDISTGLDANTGQVLGSAIQADITFTFGLPKVGQAVYPGVDLTGELRTVDIGWPDRLLKRYRPTHFLVEASDVQARIPTRAPRTHKGDCGHVYLLAGSRGKMGAAALSGTAVLRSGAGLLTLGCAESQVSIVTRKLMEAMTDPLPETDKGSIALKAISKIEKSLKGKEVLALGPGLSQDSETVSLVLKLLPKIKIPIVVDADGLNALATQTSILKKVKGPVVLTPHPGEFSRLTGVSVVEGERVRVEWASSFSKKHKVWVILKGARSIIAAPHGEVYINPTGNPGMATAGMGDVLTGIVAGFLAQGLSPTEAAIVATYLHGAAGDEVARRRGSRGLLASDLLKVLPRIIQKYTSS
jgi:NAD(P)H-hydrate epimerase